MSRRKQGRPQQRLTLDTVEQENDLLVCGDCQMNFPLRDITKFIRHKVNKCNKENKHNERDTNDGNGSEDPDPYISSKRTPISAPIARKESHEGVNKSPRLQDSAEVKKEEDETLDKELKDAKDRLPFRLKQVVDAESNTTNSEPLKFTCETCRRLYSSAWSLLQHAQREHGMRIYVTSSRDSYTPSQSPRVSTPLSKYPKDDLKLDGDKNKSSKDRDIKERSRSDSVDLHRANSSVGSASSGEGPLSGHPSPHTPFLFPRMPFPEMRHPLSPLGGPLRPPSDLRLEFPSESLYHRGAGLPGMFGLPGFEPAAPYHLFDQRPRATMSQDDFYSQRLRQLASSTSPSPARKHTPPFNQSSNTPNRIPGMFPLTPPALNTTEHEKRNENSRSLTPPGNQKSCEFCGKTFRFQSNLIVHRRSHTGEKPFKCPLCPHACTQQSKLKRHMKTHVNKHGAAMSMGSSANTSEGSRASSSSTPDSNKMGNDEDDDPEDDEEEEEEEEEDDFEMESQNHPLQPLHDRERRHMHDAGDKRDEQMKDLTKGRSELAARLFDRRIEETITKELTKEDGRKVSGSLLTEVMENTGLQNIPNYNEALKLAMAEKCTNNSKDKRNSEPINVANSSPDKEKKSEDEEDKERGTKRDKPMDSQNIMSISKMIKTEPHDKAGTPPVSSAPRVNNSMDPTYYSSLWFPAPTPDFFSRFPLPRFGVGEGMGELPPHNGFSIASTNESVVNSIVTTSVSTPTTPLPTNGTTPSAAPRKDRLRNDTCEYCGKVFKNCSNLTVHRRSHTGEKPYKCMLCSYACAQSSKLTRHMKTHGRLGKDVYKCKFCSMPFSVPSTLEKHMRKCVENANMTNDIDDCNSSDAASASDSMSAPSGGLSATPMSAPATPLSLASSLGLQLPFPLPGSLEKHMRKMAESGNASADGDETGSNSDGASVSEGLPAQMPLSMNALGLSGAAALNSQLSNSDLSIGAMTAKLEQNFGSTPSSVSLPLPMSLPSSQSLGLTSSAINSQLASAGLSLGLSQSLSGMSAAGIKMEPGLSASSPSV